MVSDVDEEAGGIGQWIRFDILIGRLSDRLDAAAHHFATPVLHPTYASQSDSFRLVIFCMDIWKTGDAALS